ncbi:DotU family type IV/VI secretion system protein [Enterobacter pasteurii]|nr:DotU family type IV/VI secretion system protein [Enterobacter pasteurii]
MNQSGIIQAEQIFYPGWLMVSQLRSGQEVQDGRALYRKARQLVTQARDKLAEAGFSQANIDTMLYAFCALLDESVLNRGKADDGWRTWQQDPLQAHFFGRLDAGEELWERIREQLKAPVAALQPARPAGAAACSNPCAITCDAHACTAGSGTAAPDVTRVLY